MDAQERRGEAKPPEHSWRDRMPFSRKDVTQLFPGVESDVEGQVSAVKVLCIASVTAAFNVSEVLETKKAAEVKSRRLFVVR